MADRGVVPEKLAAQLYDAAERLEQARKDRDRLIVEALRAGGSYREVAAHVGLSPSQILNIGRAHGWPTAEVKAERDAKWRERHRYAFDDQYIPPED